MSTARLAIGLGCLLSLVGGVLYTKFRTPPAELRYVGSAPCASCHPRIHAAWSESQHTKMMRPVDEPGVLVAEFDLEGSEIPFALVDAVWAIGGKWEQQFMGHDGRSETLLPGAWLRAAGHWDFRGWDGWQVPEPVRRCHGCHTVGLDVETGQFVEPNIGCESCHGPGEWHADTYGLGRISATADAQICGQCHTRGTTPSGEFHFPAGYRPGDDLEAHFRFSGPNAGQNSSYWWGNGRERKRHQEFQAWRRGGHANSLQSLREDYDGRFGEVTEDCLGCHAGDSVLARGRKPGVDEVREGVTCSVCHNVHGRLDEPRIGCDGCHTRGASYHEPEGNAFHVPCPADAEVGCVDCHMPQIVRIGGRFALHGHSPGVVPPSDTLAWGTPNSCANGGCHANVEPTVLQAQYDAHYGVPPTIMADAR